MNEDPHHPRFTQQTRPEQTFEQRTDGQEALEFDTPEAMLRHDAAGTPLPKGLEPRVRASLDAAPAPRRPWWRRWLGR